MARAAVEVHQATSSEGDAVLTLLDSASRASGGLGLTASRLRDRLLRALSGDEARVLLATLGGRPVGYALLTAEPPLPSAVAAGPSIEHLHVLPDCRRRGVARALLARALTIAQAEGAQQLCCAVLPGDREYTRYVAKMGFAPVVERRAVPLPVLRRRLLADAGTADHTGDVVARRRSLRDRLARSESDTQPLPVVEEVPAARAPSSPPLSSRRGRHVGSMPSGC